MYAPADEAEIERIFERRLQGQPLSKEDGLKFKTSSVVQIKVTLDCLIRLRTLMDGWESFSLHRSQTSPAVFLFKTP